MDQKRNCGEEWEARAAVKRDFFVVFLFGWGGWNLREVPKKPKPENGWATASCFSLKVSSPPHFLVHCVPLFLSESKIRGKGSTVTESWDTTK